MSPPSFEIRGAVGTPSTPRWDRVDSRALIALARSTYFNYLSTTPSGLDPLGAVIHLRNGNGRVAFEVPVLLPDEEFVGIDLIRGRSTRGRNRCRG